MVDEAAPTAPKHRCGHCDCNFSSSFNLKRHIVRKHTEPPSANFSNNGILLATDGRVLATDKCFLATTEDATHRCSKCLKIFTRKHYLGKHMEQCNGHTYLYACSTCGVRYKNKKPLNKHIKACKLTNTELTLPIPATNPIQNIQTQNNIQQQTNVYNLIVYHPNNTRFNHEHITSSFIQKIIRNNDSDARVIQEYTREMLALPENQCIKKDDLKSAHSMIHIGNNQWITERDDTIYPNIVKTITSDMSDTLNKYKQTLTLLQSRYQQLLRETDYMADDGYINTDDIEIKKEKRKNYLQLIQFLKIAIHNQTKMCKQLSLVNA